MSATENNDFHSPQRGRKRKFDIGPDSIMSQDENHRRTVNFIGKHIYNANEAIFPISGEKTTMISNEDFRKVTF